MKTKKKDRKKFRPALCPGCGNGTCVVEYVTVVYKIQRVNSRLMAEVGGTVVLEESGTDEGVFRGSECHEEWPFERELEATIADAREAEAEAGE